VSVARRRRPVVRPVVDPKFTYGRAQNQFLRFRLNNKIQAQAEFDIEYFM
jgi:hypothetical protein